MDSKLHTHIISKLFLVLLVINVVGCKSVKNAVLNNDINTSLTTKQIIKEHYFSNETEQKVEKRDMTEDERFGSQMLTEDYHAEPASLTAIDVYKNAISKFVR